MTWEDSVCDSRSGVSWYLPRWLTCEKWHHRFAPTNRGCCIAIPSTSHGLDLDQERLPWFNRGAFVVWVLTVELRTKDELTTSCRL